MHTLLARAKRIIGWIMAPLRMSGPSHDDSNVPDWF